MSQLRLNYSILVLITIGMGLISRVIFNVEYLGDVLWGLMAFMLIRIILIHKNIKYTIAFSLIFSCLIELSQLVQGQWINSIRHTVLGRLVLGYGFLWSDLVCYTIGIIIGVVIDYFMKKVIVKKPTNINKSLKRVKFILLGFIILANLLLIVVIILSSIDVYIYPLKLIPINEILFLIGVIFGCFGLWLLLSVQRAVKMIILVTGLIMSFILFPILIFALEEGQFREYHSPRGTNTLVVEDYCHLISGGATIYEKQNQLIIKKLDYDLINIDGCFISIKSTNWIDENTVEIVYYNGYKNVTETITFSK